MVEGRKTAATIQAVEIWRIVFGEKEKKVQMVDGDQADQVWDMASRFFG